MKTALPALAWMLLAASVGCDPAAKAGGDDDGIAASQLSRRGESCATSLHCAEGLRCVDRVCRSAQTSVLGEIYAAAGDEATRAHDSERAIRAYTDAVNQYEADKVPPPAELYRALGQALAADPSDRVRAERAARMLHRCVLAAPAGSSARAAAMHGLARLLDVGLDPLLLARDTPADAYLTKAPAVPPIDKLRLTATVVGRTPGSRTFSRWLALLGSDEVKQALGACWKEHQRATHAGDMSVKLSFRYSYRLDAYDDFDRSVLTVADVPAGADPASKATACVRAALVPIADRYAKQSAEATWRAEIQLVLGP